MRVKVRLSKLNDLSIYTDLLQKTYQDAYTNESIGLTKNCFSKEVFASKDTQDYLKSHLINSNKQKTWLAFIESKLVGAITCIIINKGEAELTGFYVDTKYQGKGIGKKLYKLALAFANRRDLVLDIYAHNKKTITMYKKWGWLIDRTKGKGGYFFRHWPEWPKGLQARAVYMRLSFSPVK